MNCLQGDLYLNKAVYKEQNLPQEKSKPIWLHWQILSKFKEKSNTNSREILSKNWWEGILQQFVPESHPWKPKYMVCAECFMFPLKFIYWIPNSQCDSV